MGASEGVRVRFGFYECLPCAHTRRRTAADDRRGEGQMAAGTGGVAQHG